MADLKNSPLLPIFDENNKLGFLNKFGKIVIEPQFEMATPFHEGYAAVQTRNQNWNPIWGAINEEGKIIIQPRFKFFRGFSEGLGAVVELESQKYGFINPADEMVIEQKFSHVYSFQEGLCPATLDDKKYGYIDITGNFIIKPQFQDAQVFSEGLAGVKIGKHWGYINKKGEIVIQPVFKRVWSFQNGRAQVVSDGKEDKNKILLAYKKNLDIEEFKGKWGVINTQGNYEILPQFEYSESEFHGMSTAEQSSGRPRNTLSNALIVEESQGASKFSEGLAPARIKHKWGFIDTAGTLVIKNQFGEVGEFSQGLAPVKAGGTHDWSAKWGFINKKGEMIIAPQFHLAFIFSEGLAPVLIGGETLLEKKAYWGYINTQGEFQLKPKFETATLFEHGLAQVTLNNKKCYIDKSGQIIWS